MNKADRYTTSEDTDLGNGLLKYPVGLVTSDEVVAAGGFLGASNSSYYLYNNQDYWTMSPHSFYPAGGTNATVFKVDASGGLGYNAVCNDSDGSFGVRPVLNLRSDVTLSGKGTSSSPFEVVG